MISELFFKEAFEVFAFKVPFETFVGVIFSGPESVAETPRSLLVACHEGNCCHEHGPDVPACGPALLVIVRKGGTDGFVGLEPATGGVEHEFWGFEGIVLVQLQYTPIISVFVAFLKSVDTEVKLKDTFAGDQNVRNRILIQFSLLLLESKKSYFLIGHHVIIIILI